MSKMSKTTEFGDEITEKYNGSKWWYNDQERIVYDCKLSMSLNDSIIEGIEGTWKWISYDDGDDVIIQLYTNTRTGEKMLYAEQKKYKKLLRFN